MPVSLVWDTALPTEIYVDESGDLGWKFDHPYRLGGSSRFITISAVVCPEDDQHHLRRFIKRLYQKHNWSAKDEIKWTSMSDAQRWTFAQRAKRFCRSRSAIQVATLTCRKEEVEKHIRADCNKLYNYMIKLLLLQRMSHFDEVRLVPDPRSIKVDSGNSLHDYLQTELWFEQEVVTQLETCPRESKVDKGVQFSDMIAGLVQSHYEDGKSDPFHEMRSIIQSRTLFF